MVLNVVSLSFTCYCVNVCIHLCLARKLLFTASYSMYDHHLKSGFSFLHLLLVNLDINWFMSAGKLLFIWSAFICLISILYMIMVLNVVSLSFTCYCVNTCIHLCLARKLLFTASYSMYDHHLKCGFSFLDLLLWTWTSIDLCQPVSYFSFDQHSYA